MFEVFLARLDRGATRVAVLFLQRDELVTDDLQQHVGVFENLDQARDRHQQLLVFVGQLFLFETGQAIEAHFEDVLRLQLGQLIAVRLQARIDRHVFRTRRVRAGRREQRANHARLPAPREHALLRFVRRRRGLDQLDHLVDVRQRDGQAFDDVRTRTRLAQVEDRAAGDDFATMADERVEDLAQRQRARLAIDQRDHVDAERDLQLGLLEQVVEQHVGRRVAAHFDDDAQAVLVGLVAQRPRCPRCFFSLTSSAIFSISRALFTWNGSSVTMIVSRPLSSVSISALARTRMRPRPVLYASTMPEAPLMMPAVGKSGPGTMRMQVVETEFRIVDQRDARGQHFA